MARSTRSSSFLQLERKVVDVGEGCLKVAYEYTEHGSKNRSGGIKQLRMQNKVVRQYEDPLAGDRCHVHILDLYLLKVPKEAKERGAFYLRALANAPQDPTLPWFSQQPIGRNKLNTMMKTMSTQTGLPVLHTNHSLRSYGATKLFQDKVPEKLIQERTGHRSIDALRKYERISEEQKVATSLALNSSKNITPQLPAAPLSLINPTPQASSSFLTTNSANFPNQQPQPNYSGCTFNGCSFTVNIIQRVDPCLHGVDPNELFADF